jgi:hypothetical protein
MSMRMRHMHRLASDRWESVGNPGKSNCADCLKGKMVV